MKRTLARNRKAARRVRRPARPAAAKARGYLDASWSRAASLLGSVQADLGKLGRRLARKSGPYTRRAEATLKDWTLWLRSRVEPRPVRGHRREARRRRA